MPSAPLPMNAASPAPLPDDAEQEREFDAFARTQDPLDIEAAMWMVRRRGGLDAHGQAALQAWLDADPRHAAALDEMDSAYANIKRLPDTDTTALGTDPRDTHDPSPATAPSNPASVRQRTHRRGHLARTMAAALAFVIIGWASWQYRGQQPLFDQSFATGPGQQQTITLPDAGDQGSHLQLDTATRMDARLYSDRREVRLHNGQAMFTVAPDATRPFHVRAGALRITVVGTRFSVRQTTSGLDAGQTVIAVEEGHVRVAPADQANRDEASPAAPLELTAGQMAVADQAGRLSAVIPIPTSAIAPWRDGRVNFDQTPLSTAIAEFERYGNTGLIVRDPAVAAMRVGGSYGVRQWRHFTETLPQVLPIRLVRRGNITEIVAR